MNTNLSSCIVLCTLVGFILTGGCAKITKTPSNSELYGKWGVVESKIKFAKYRVLEFTAPNKVLYREYENEISGHVIPENELILKKQLHGTFEIDGVNSLNFKWNKPGFYANEYIAKTSRDKLLLSSGIYLRITH